MIFFQDDGVCGDGEEDESTLKVDGNTATISDRNSMPEAQRLPRSSARGGFAEERGGSLDRRRPFFRSCFPLL